MKTHRKSKHKDVAAKLVELEKETAKDSIKTTRQQLRLRLTKNLEARTFLKMNHK